MNSSMSLHRITSIKTQRFAESGLKWTELRFSDKDENRFTLAVHAADWLPIEGAHQIKQATQEVAAADPVTSMADALWQVLREVEDKCDVELADIGKSHMVWQLANVAIGVHK